MEDQKKKLINGNLKSTKLFRLGIRPSLLIREEGILEDFSLLSS